MDRVTISTDRSQRILLLVRTVLEQETVNLADLAKLLGMMVSCQDIVPWSRFHLQPLQSFLRPYQRDIAIKCSLRLKLTPKLRVALRWWSDPLRFSQGVQLREPDRILVTTDASLSGWGAHTDKRLAQGVWSIEEQTYSINLLELRAIKLALY